jgi:hypothetical protein
MSVSHTRSLAGLALIGALAAGCGTAVTAQHPAPLVGTSAWAGPIEAAGGVETLRERYPLVTALLIELAALSRRGTVAPPTQQRG